MPYVADQVEKNPHCGYYSTHTQHLVYIVVDFSIGSIHSEPITLKWLCN